MENVLLNAISPDEYKMLKKWRDWYASNDGDLRYNTQISIREVLDNAWARSNHTLYKLLGNNLIRKFKFTYHKSSDEIANELRDMIDGREALGREGRQAWKFVSNYLVWVQETYPYIEINKWNPHTMTYYRVEPEVEEKSTYNTQMRFNLNSLVDYDYLSKNRYGGETFSIPMPNGKEYVVSQGCKPLKVLAKLADAFNIEDFEDFRICHSMAHNQKHIDSELVLSIHPLDYWTMSDNECDWESCMNWREGGAYRQGTVEMMNSPMVVVAYMEASEPMSIDGKDWSNKRWRQLFIVNEEVILGVKSYPYFNEFLTNEIMKILKDLAKENLGWEYYNDEPIEYEFQLLTNPNGPEDQQKFKFEFNTGFMYTDVGCCVWHPMFVGKHVCADYALNEGKEKWQFEDSRIHSYQSHWSDSEKIVVISVDYSGESQCVNCGKLTNNFDSECYVCCSDCEASIRCNECGYRMSESDGAIQYNGYYYCVDCWEECFRECAVTGEMEYKDDMRQIYIKIPTSEEYKNKLVKENGYNPPPRGYTNEVILRDPIYIGWNREEEFEKQFLLPGEKIQWAEQPDYWGSIAYVSIDQIDINNPTWSCYLPYPYTKGDFEPRQDSYDKLCDIWSTDIRIRRLKRYVDTW